MIHNNNIRWMHDVYYLFGIGVANVGQVETKKYLLILRFAKECLFILHNAIVAVIGAKKKASVLTDVILRCFIDKLLANRVINNILQCVIFNLNQTFHVLLLFFLEDAPLVLNARRNLDAIIRRDYHDLIRRNKST